MTDKTPASRLDATLTSRYECKYLIDRRTADALRRYLSSHAQLDPFSEEREDRRYRVLSLYLDSLGLRLYRDTAQGVRNRFKLRLRYYEESLEGPIFFEVKKRADVIVRKSRERVTGAEANDFLIHGECRSERAHGKDFHEFLDRCFEVDARPALRIRYWREAWESRGVDPVRITFDTEVEHCTLSERGLIEARPDWRPTPIRSDVILEVKFTDLRPRWVTQMLQIFQLDKLSVAKYAESVDAVQDRGSGHELRARMSFETGGPRAEAS